MNNNSSTERRRLGAERRDLVYGDPKDDSPTNAVNLQQQRLELVRARRPVLERLPSPRATTRCSSGAIVGYSVTLGNKSHFTYEADTGPLQNPALGLYYRSYYEQCPTKPSSGTDPTSGC